MVTGSNSNLFFSDAALTADHAINCHLSVLLDRDALSWCVVERSSALHLEVGRTALDEHGIRALAADHPWKTALQSRRYGSSSLAVRSTAYSLMPTSFYAPEQAAALLNVLFGPSDRQVEKNEITALGAVMVFSPPNDHAIIRQQMPEAKLLCNAALIIESVLRFPRFEGEVQVFCDLSLTFMDVVVVADKRVLFCNSFDISGDEDALYHSQNTLQQLGLTDREMVLYLSGAIAVGGERYKLFQNYFKKVNIHFGFQMPKVAPALADLRKQEVMALLNQYVCVS
jgi:hypothetical protein